VTEQSWFSLNPELAKKPRSIESASEEVQPQNTPLKLAEPLTKHDLQNMLGELSTNLKSSMNKTLLKQNVIEELDTARQRDAQLVTALSAISDMVTEQNTVIMAMDKNRALEQEVLTMIKKELQK